MRKLWSIVSFLAVVNLLALLMFVGWLVVNDRLDLDRVRAIRDQLATTVTAERMAEEDALAVASEAEAEAEAQALRDDPPLPSDAQVRLTSQQDDQMNQASLRARDESTQLLAQLEARIAQVERERERFQGEKKQWDDSVAEERQRRIDEQFQKTVKQYETAKPKLAKEWMQNLVEQGEIEQVVSYLDAMSPRASTKILAEFKTAADTQLATELLERLRTLGLAEAQETDGSDDDRDPTDARNASGSP